MAARRRHRAESVNTEGLPERSRAPTSPTSPHAEAIGRRCKRILPLRLGDLKNRDIVLPVAGYSMLVTSNSLKPDDTRYAAGNRFIVQAFAVGNLPVCAWPNRTEAANVLAQNNSLHFRGSTAGGHRRHLEPHRVPGFEFGRDADAPRDGRDRRRLHLLQRRRDG